MGHDFGSWAVVGASLVIFDLFSSLLGHLSFLLFKAKEVHDGTTRFVVKSENTFRRWKGDFLFLLRELHSGRALELHNLINHSQSGLLLASNKIGSNTENIDLMVLGIELLQRFFVDVV
jgi:hypothetical protein